MSAFAFHLVIQSLVLQMEVLQCNPVTEPAGYCEQACMSVISVLSSVSITDL